MLILIERLERRGSEFTGATVRVGINPDTITEVEPAWCRGINKPCVKITTENGPVYAIGTVSEVIRAANWEPDEEDTEVEDEIDSEVAEM